jgi:hypothetical protein
MIELEAIASIIVSFVMVRLCNKSETLNGRQMESCC